MRRREARTQCSEAILAERGRQQQVHAEDDAEQSDDERGSLTFQDSPCFSGHGSRFFTFACICFFCLHDDSN
jgi:hypothetical protein